MSFKTPDLLDNNEARTQDGRVRVVTPMFQRYGGRPSFSGQIVTLKVFEDNSLVREALAEEGQGKVLVIDGGGSLAARWLVTSWPSWRKGTVGKESSFTAAFAIRKTSATLTSACERSTPIR
jgi:regulator of RNase E activity RraA